MKINLYIYSMVKFLLGNRSYETPNSTKKSHRPIDSPLQKNLLKSLHAKGVQNCCAALPEPKRIKERNEISYVKLKSMMVLLTTARACLKKYI
jgi:hypothetical protein